MAQEDIRGKDLPNIAIAFADDDIIIVDGDNNGTRRMSKDTLLELTAQNALAGNVAPAFVPNETNAVANKPYAYDGKFYIAKEDYSGPWDASKFSLAPSSDYYLNPEALKNISKHIIVTASRGSLGSVDVPFYFFKGLSYRIVNTSADVGVSASTVDYGKSGVETIASTILPGKSKIFTPTKDAVYFHVYFNSATGGTCTVECLDGLNERISAIETSGVKEAVSGDDFYKELKTAGCSSNVTISDGVATIQIVNQDTFFKITLSKPLVSAKKYTLAFDVEDFSGSSIAMEFFCNSEKFKIEGDGHYSVVFGGSSAEITIDDVSRAGATIGDSFKMTNFHVYEGTYDYSVDTVVVAPQVEDGRLRVLSKDNYKSRWLRLNDIVRSEWTKCGGNGMAGQNFIIDVKPNTFYTLSFKEPGWTITGIASYQSKWSVFCLKNDNTSLGEIGHYGDYNVSANNVFFTPPETRAVRIFIRADVGQSVEFSIHEGYSECVPVASVLEAFAAIKYDSVFVAGLFSDTHGFANMFEVIPSILDTNLEIASTNDHNRLCDCILDLGDNVREYPTETNALVPYSKVYEKKFGVPVLPICGNHDFGASYAIDGYQELSKVIATIFNPAVQKGYIPETASGDYVVDFASQKVRIICINGYLHGGTFDENGNWERVQYDASKPTILKNTAYTTGFVGNLEGWTDYSYRAKVNLTTPQQSLLDNQKSADYPCWVELPNNSYLTPEQKQWYVDSLLATPANYSVIVAMHTVFSRNCTWDKTRKFSDKNFDQSRFPNGVMNLDYTDFVANSTKAFIDGDNFSQDGASVDFSNKASGVKFICFVGGHYHRDGIVYHDMYNELKQVLVTTTSDKSYTSAPDIAVYANCPTITLLRVEKAKNRISLAKIGSRVSKDGYVRDYEIIDL